MLGILDEDGMPVRSRGILGPPAKGSASKTKVVNCRECDNHAVLMKEGCDSCSACGWGVGR